MANAKSDRTGEATSVSGWRIKAGFAILLFSLIGMPVLVGILAVTGFAGSNLAAISGGLLVAAELMMVLGAAVAGKDGFAYIKSTVFGALKAYGPPQTVGPVRYRIGLVMFLLPLIFAWVSFYKGNLFPGLVEHKLTYAIAGDVMLAVSLFVLGGEFWEKLRSLFVHRATAVFPDAPKKAK